MDATGILGRSWNNHVSDCQHVVIDASFDELVSVPYLDFWFKNIGALQDIIGLEHIHGTTSLVQTFSSSGIRRLNLSKFDGSAVASISSFCESASNLEFADLSCFTSAQLNNADNAFTGCSKLKTVNLFGFNASSLERMAAMFADCPKLTYIDFSAFKTTLTQDQAFSLCVANDTLLEDVNLTGLKITGRATESGAKGPFWNSTNISHITFSNGFFNWTDYSDGYTPDVEFYAYRDGEEVAGDTYGYITKARIDADSPTTFIKDKTATYNDYFFANGGTYASGADVATTSGTVNQSATAPAQPTRPGYIFKGWKIADGTAVPTNANADYNFGKYGISTYNSFYADWEEAATPVTLSFDANGGTFASSGAATLTLTNQTPGDTLATVETPSKEGYEFGGWKDASGATIVFPLTIPDVNATYTATWTAEPGPTPPGPTPKPTPDINPATDATLLPVTGDTAISPFAEMLFCLGTLAVVSAFMASVSRMFKQLK